MNRAALFGGAAAGAMILAACAVIAWNAYVGFRTIASAEERCFTRIGFPPSKTNRSYDQHLTRCMREQGALPATATISVRRVSSSASPETTLQFHTEWRTGSTARNSSGGPARHT